MNTRFQQGSMLDDAYMNEVVLAGVTQVVTRTMEQQDADALDRFAEWLHWRFGLFFNECPSLSKRVNDILTESRIRIRLHTKWHGQTHNRTEEVV